MDTDFRYRGEGKGISDICVLAVVVAPKSIEGLAFLPRLLQSDMRFLYCCSCDILGSSLIEGIRGQGLA